MKVTMFRNVVLFLRKIERATGSNLLSLPQQLCEKRAQIEATALANFDA